MSIDWGRFPLSNHKENPFGEYKDNLRKQKKDLATMWKGSSDISFIYSLKTSSRRTRNVTLKEFVICRDHKRYFLCFCPLRGRYRTFPEDNIASQITLEGKKYPVADFIDKLENLSLGNGYL